jgi:hypothetical protein
MAGLVVTLIDGTRRRCEKGEPAQR